MSIPLDTITQRKLILARQIYQRALIQAQVSHSYVDRILAIISFDLTNESVLKAIVGALDRKKNPDKDFHGILQQAESCLLEHSLPALPDKPKIQHVHDLRNDAQHKAKYPNEMDVSDCRTYTRDFFEQVVFDVWGQRVNSLSLTNIVQNGKVRDYLSQAEDRLSNDDYQKAIEFAEAAVVWSLNRIESAIVGPISYRTKAILVEGGSRGPVPSREVFKAFEKMRDILLRSMVGIDFRSYNEYQRIVRSVIQAISFFEDGDYDVNLNIGTPNKAEAEYAVQFGINAVIQIESLVGDIEKPLE